MTHYIASKSERDAAPKKYNGEYFYLSAKGDVCLTHYYYNPDTKCWGFGFNASDGAGFVADTDLTEDTVVTAVSVRIARIS